MSSGGAPKQEVSEAEKFQGEQAVARWNERVEDGYLQLEQDAVADSKLDHSDMFEGMAAADVSIAEAETYKNSPNTHKALAEIGRDITEASDTAQVDAKVNATEFKDKKGLAMVQLGSDVALNSAEIASSSARQGASKASSVLEAKNTKRAAKAQATMQVVDSAIQAGVMRQEGYSMKGGDINQEVTTEDAVTKKKKTETKRVGSSLGFLTTQSGL